jgi:hypothetical protein
MISTIEDLNQYSGKTLLEKVKTFVDEFEKQYAGECVPPIVFTAYQLIGRDTIQLNLDPYWKNGQ